MAIITTFKETMLRGGFPGIGMKGGIIENTLDLAETNAASADVIEIFSLPAGTLVSYVGSEVLTIEDSTFTFEVGDGTDPNGWLAGINGETLGHTLGAGAFVNGKLYAVADTIDMTLNDAVDAAIIRVWAVVWDIENLDGS